MSEQNATLDTIYENWKKYQETLAAAIAPLTPEQLALRASDNHRTIAQLARHMVNARVAWFTYTLGEQYESVKPLFSWNGADTPTPTADELVAALDTTWQMLMDAVSRWSSDDMAQTFPDEDDYGNLRQVSRSWVMWHLLEHDLHHGGEISLTLGMHGLKAVDI